MILINMDLHPAAFKLCDGFGFHKFWFRLDFDLIILFWSSSQLPFCFRTTDYCV